MNACLAALYGPTPSELIAKVVEACDRAAATADQLARLRVPEIAEQLAIQAEAIVRAANKARAVLAKGA